jgi:hypothetical protein
MTGNPDRPALRRRIDAGRLFSGFLLNPSGICRDFLMQDDGIKQVGLKIIHIIAI